MWNFIRASRVSELPRGVPAHFAALACDSSTFEDPGAPNNRSGKPLRHLRSLRSRRSYGFGAPRAVSIRTAHTRFAAVVESCPGRAPNHGKTVGLPLVDRCDFLALRSRCSRRTYGFSALPGHSEMSLTVDSRRENARGGLRTLDLRMSQVRGRVLAGTTGVRAAFHCNPMSAAL